MLSVVIAAVASSAEAEADCSFQDSYPQQYVVHKTAGPPVMDGRLDDKLWKEVPWTEIFVDIATTVKPRFQTRAKLRYDDKFIYVGAEISEPEVWANITHTCHCLNNTEDQVIFHDNDFEIFTNPDGTTHNYKEYEMNALNQTWDLLLERAYDDGGGENSTRVDGKNGWDMQPPLYCATQVQGTINDPSDTDQGWTVEVALPLEKLGFNQLPTLNVPPLDGDYWRMDFSRVEYHVNKVGHHYEKTAAPCDNWVWSPIGVVSMHQPDRWGMLQFSTGKPGQVKPVPNPEWPLRESAMATYYAQHAYKTKHGNYTEELSALVPFIPSWLKVGPQAIDGTCAKGSVTTHPSTGTFDATFTSLDGKAASHVNDARYLTVTRQQDAGGGGGGADPEASAVPSRALLAPSFVGTDWSKLSVKEVPMPNISTPTTVIVQVVGSSVNPVDWKIIEARLFPGLPATFPAKLGMDMAGVVVKVGPGCTRLKVGDEVWADLADDGLGGYATYAQVEESHLGIKPANLAWDSASVLPLVSMTSLAALKTAGAPWSADSSTVHPRAGGSRGGGSVQNATNTIAAIPKVGEEGEGKESPQRKADGPVVMVLGGSGGCGFTGIQMAKAFGASEIWTTTSFLNFDFVKTMGATRVFNYKTQDWTKIVDANSVDIVYDTVGVAGSAQACMRPLKPGGWFVTIAGDLAKTPKQGVKQQFIEHWPKNATTLDEIATLVTEGKLIAEIQSVYSIYDIAQAFDDSQGGEVVGKLFINTTAGPDDILL